MEDRLDIPQEKFERICTLAIDTALGYGWSCGVYEIPVAFEYELYIAHLVAVPDGETDTGLPLVDFTVELSKGFPKTKDKNEDERI